MGPTIFAVFSHLYLLVKPFERELLFTLAPLKAALSARRGARGGSDECRRYAGSSSILIRDPRLQTQEAKGRINSEQHVVCGETPQRLEEALRSYLERPWQCVALLRLSDSHRYCGIATLSLDHGYLLDM